MKEKAMMLEEQKRQKLARTSKISAPRASSRSPPQQKEIFAPEEDQQFGGDISSIIIDPTQINDDEDDFAKLATNVADGEDFMEPRSQSLNQEVAPMTQSRGPDV